MTTLYRRQPEQIEAVQYVEGQEDEVLEFIGSGEITEDGAVSFEHAALLRSVTPTGWVLKESSGFLNVLTDEAFTALYGEASTLPTPGELQESLASMQQQVDFIEGGLEL